MINPPIQNVDLETSQIEPPVHHEFEMV